MSGADKEDKQFAASPKRLEELRRQGRIPRSTDLIHGAALAGLVLALAGFGGWSVGKAGKGLSRLLGDADHLSRAFATGARGAAPGPIGPVLAAVAPLLLLPAFGAVAMIALQRGWLVTPGNLAPKLARISPLAAAAQKFGPAGLFDFGKALAKLELTITLSGWFLTAHLPGMIGTVLLPPAAIMAALFRYLLDFLTLVLGGALVIGGGDYLWQILRHRRDAMMSRQEMQEEHKDSEGDPHAKAHRKEKGKEIALNRMLQDVAQANVVIVNPTHYAVALRWDRASRRAPVCVAKGMDEVAARIRERAMLSAVPIHADPPTARALHATVSLGEEILPEHYKAVAAAIRFAEAMRRKAGQRRR